MQAAVDVRAYADPPTCCRLLRLRVAYGSTNKYNPESKSKASGKSGE